MVQLNPRHLSSPKASLGFKRWLLSLNRDIDRVKGDVHSNRDLAFVVLHSITGREDSLTHVETAILYLEDRRFFSHFGVEVRSFLRSIRRFLLKGRLGGMSTIDQQVVRISLNRYERTLSRKARETILAILLNLHCSKRIIFDYYIHNAYLGYGMRGVEVASRKIFGVEANHLSEDQAVLIASLFPLPFPRVVWDVYSVARGYPFSCAKDILTFAEKTSPRWAARIRYRMEIASQAYARMPSNL